MNENSIKNLIGLSFATNNALYYSRILCCSRIIGTKCVSENAGVSFIMRKNQFVRNFIYFKYSVHIMEIIIVVVITLNWDVHEGN